MQRARLIVAGAMLLAVGGCGATGPVRGWTETVVIPTYPVGSTDDLPNFDRREVYPYSRQADLSFERRDVEYKAYFAENEYLRIEVLPELGGRLFAMVDKVTGQDILYRQVSIKPGLVGLRGAWICGGIEWNFPRGHNVTTHDLVSCRLLRHDDGSVSIVVGDTERTFRMSWTVEMRLRPGKAYVETRIVCRNPTPVMHQAGWWSNAAFPTTKDTQLLFPFHKTTGHGGGGVQDWPVRDGEDMSWFWKHRNATSTFRAAGEEDFIGAYDHASGIGLVQYADRRVMPGRKWWTWGTSEAGLRWAGILSDDNRPYLELQSGRPLTQGEQFDMQPHEEIEFLEYWMPVTRIGPPARVNPEAAVRLTVKDGTVGVGVLPTGPIEQGRVELSAGGRVLKQWQGPLSPAEPLNAQLPLGDAAPADLWLRVFDGEGRELIAHRYGHYAPGPTLTGPQAPAQEKPQDQQLARAATLIRQGAFDQARKLLAPLCDGASANRDVARYYLGVAEAHLGRTAQAMEAWNAVPDRSAVGTAALMEGAKLLLAQRKWQEAIDRLEPLVNGRPAHALAQVYTALALRKSGRDAQANALLDEALQKDPLLLVGQVERALLQGARLTGLSALRDEQRRIEAATAYMGIGGFQVADRLLAPPAGSDASATALYLRARVAELTGQADAARRLRREAAKASVRGCMPSRREEVSAFQAAIDADPDDASAHYLAGLVLYSWKRADEAIAHWREAERLEHPDAVVYQCIAKALGDSAPAEAVRYYERALTGAPEAEQLYVELDAAYERLGRTAERIKLLEQGTDRLPDRHDLAHRLALAYFDAGRYDEAVTVYRRRQFRVAEGRYELHDHYAMALVGRASEHLAASRNAEALKDLAAAEEYPENLGIGRPDRDAGDATVLYWRGVALDRLGQAPEAKQAWTQAAGLGRISRRIGPDRPQRAIHVVHAAAALRRLGKAAEAKDLGARLEEACRRYEDDPAGGGKTFVAMIRGYLAATEGRRKDAEAALRQVQADPARPQGHVLLIGKWVDLLGQSEAPQARAEGT